jgi:hypothetical protein
MNGLMRCCAGFTAALALGGCITHEARVQIGTDATEDRGAGQPGAATVYLLEEEWGGESRRESPFPLELPVGVWRRNAQGELQRGWVSPATPRPWWQRFPFDLGTDLWPQEFRIIETATVVPRTVPVTDERTLTALAKEFGYAAGLPETDSDSPR